MNRVEIIGARRLLTLLVLASAMTGCGFLRRDPPPIDTSQDARILREVEARLAREPAIDARTIRVSVEGAVVSLYGSVAGIDAWNCAMRNAQLVDGVRIVVEYLTIERGSGAVPCRALRDDESSMARNLPPLFARS